MALKNQTLTISTDFPNQKVDPAKFRDEIHADPDGVMVTIVSNVWTQGDTCHVDFVQDISAAEQTRLGELAALHDGEPASSVETVTFPESAFDNEGNLKTSPIARPGSEAYFFTHNYCDPCSWYQEAVKHTEVALSPNSSSRIWKHSEHRHWIDLTHGRIFNEDAIPNATDYVPVIEVSTDGGSTWEQKAENSWDNNDRDYRIEYEAGEVHFNADLDPSAQVRATFYKAGTARFTIRPKPGRMLRIKYVETQYEADIEMTTNLVFEIWMYAAALAQTLLASDDSDEVLMGQQLQAAIDGGLVQPTDMQQAIRRVYKRLQDFYIESTGPFPTILRHGGRNDRAMPADLHTIPFQYLSDRVLLSSAGVEVRIFNEGDIPFRGTFGNSTFYCISERE
jgi:hypothetical protein